MIEGVALISDRPPNENPPYSHAGIEEEGEAEGEKSGSDEDDDEEGIPESMCDDGEHKWAHNVCMVCSFCGFCTGYGPECCNEGLPGREKGKYVHVSKCPII